MHKVNFSVLDPKFKSLIGAIPDPVKQNFRFKIPGLWIPQVKISRTLESRFLT